MASAGHERTERRHAVRRRAILDAAATEFAEAGYQAATLDRIGDRVGLTKASLYHYVQGKEQLLAALLDRVTADIAVQATVPADAHDPADIHLPSVQDGLEGIAFVETCVKSNRMRGNWTTFRV